VADHPAKNPTTLPDWHPDSPWYPWGSDIANRDIDGNE